MKRLIACSLGLAAAMAFAFPTPSQFSAAQNDVNELMRTLREDYRAKRKTAVEVADAAHGYLSSADTDAAKFLLYREVICFSARGGDFDKAAQAVKDLESAIDDIPPQKLVDLMREALARKSREEGGALWELFSARNEQLQLQNKLEKMRAAVEADPAKPTLRVAYAEALAQLGKWKEALAEYAKAGGVYAEYAKAEQSGKGKTFRELGDFWWGYRIRGGKVSPAMKTHAAQFYRKAIVSGEATGLVARNLQNRIDEMREELEAIENPWEIDMESKEPQEMVFDFGNGVKTTFVACRGGDATLTLGYLPKDDIGKGAKVCYRKVKVTRPFWVAKRSQSVSEYLLFNKTYKGYEESKAKAESKNCELYMGYQSSSSNRSYNAWEYFDWLNKTYGKRLPKGWVFRPMTMAETAVVITNMEIKEYSRSESMSIKDFGVLPKRYADIGVLEKLYVTDFMCDRLSVVNSSEAFSHILDVNPETSNPFWYSDDKNAYKTVWGRRKCSFQADVYWTYSAVRIAVGPDYVGEWKAKHAQK